MSKVYARVDENGYITRIEGGYTTPIDLTGWVLLDEGEGDRYNLCQSNYFPGPLTTDSGASEDALSHMAALVFQPAQDES